MYKKNTNFAKILVKLTAMS